MGALFQILLCVLGQDLGGRSLPQKEATLVEHATIHTVSGGTVEDGWILFDGGTIVAVGRGPKEAPRRIDATGRHVYPGFIAVDTQLGLTEIGAVRATRDTSEVGGVTPEVRACVALNPDSTLIPVARTNGVLLAGVFPTGGAISGRASAIRLDGWTWEEMTVRPEAGIVVQWPIVRPIRAWWMDRSDEEQMKEAEKNLALVRDAFERAAAWRAARAADPATPVDLRWEAMDPELPLFIHAQDHDQIVSAVDFAVARGWRCVIVGGRDAPLCADLLRRHEVGVIAQGTIALPKRDDSDFDEPYRLPARLKEAGIRFCLTSGEEAAHERNLPYSAAMAVAHGLDRGEAIRSITLSAAEMLGIADRYGSLEAGKSATLLITDGDPLEVTTRVVMAFLDGRELDLSNKQTALAAKYRSKYRPK